MTLTNTITVEFFIDGAWADVTRLDNDTYVLGLEGTNAITSTHGQSKFGASNRTPDSITFQYLDNNATLDGDNPLSPYYEKIGQYTPIRVKIDGSVVAIGELASAIPTWDPAGQRVIVTITANSIDRRLGQGKKPLNSPIYRDIMSMANDTGRVAYWPIEDGRDATHIASPMMGVQPLTITDTVNLSAFESPGSAPIATLGESGSLQGQVPTYDDGETKVVTIWQIPEDGYSTGTVLFRMFGTGTITRWDVWYHSANDGTLFFAGYDVGGTLINDAQGSSFVNGTHFLTSLEMEQDGSDVDIVMVHQVINVNDPQDGGLFIDSWTTQTMGRITSIIVAPNGDCTGLSVGHLAVSSERTLLAALGDAIVGHASEPAGTRIERLCDELGIAFSNVGDLTDTALMGAQPRAQFMDALFDAVSTDGGILYQKNTALEFVYRTRVSLYNQTPELAITYAAPSAHLSPEFLPRFTDIARRNDVTLSRPHGSIGRYVIPDDEPEHFTTQDPPTGMGVADVKEDRNVHTDDQLDNHAAWWAHLGSWKEKVISPMIIELHRDVWVADSARTADVRAITIGDMTEVTTTNAPRWIRHPNIRMLILGLTRTFGQLNDTFSFHTTPGDAWEVEVNDS